MRKPSPPGFKSSSQRPRIVTVLLSCPGDVEKEKNKLEAAVHDLNSRFQKQGLMVIPWRHERDVVPTMAEDAQDAVNKQMPEYDIYVGVMCGRLGTPTARSVSGTLEEFEQARTRFLQEGKPRILFYFCCDPVKQVEALRNSFSGLYSIYENAENLESKFKHHMLDILLDELSQNEALPPCYPNWTKFLAGKLDETVKRRPPTYLDYSSQRVFEIMRRLDDLLNIRIRPFLHEKETAVLLAAEFVLGFLAGDLNSLDKQNRQGFEHALPQDSLSPEQKEATYLAIRGANPNVDLKQIREASPFEIRSDLIAALIRIGEIVSLDHALISPGFRGSPPPNPNDLREWIAFSTEKISIDSNQMTFYLKASTPEEADLLKASTALRVEALWQNNRNFFMDNQIVIAAKSEIRVSPEVFKFPVLTLDKLQENSDEIKNAIPHLTHLGQSDLGETIPQISLVGITPFPESAISAPLTFSLNENFQYQLIVVPIGNHKEGCAIQNLHSNERGQIVLDPSILSPGIPCLWRLLRNDQDLGFSQEAIGEVRTLTERELFTLNFAEQCLGASERRAIQFKLRLWNEIIEELWPKLNSRQASIEECWLCHRILVSAYEWVLDNSPDSTQLEVLRNAENWVYAQLFKE